MAPCDRRGGKSDLATEFRWIQVTSMTGDLMMRSILLAAAALFGMATFFAQAQTASNPSQGQLVAPYGAGPAPNNNNNAWGVANTPSGGAAAGPSGTTKAGRDNEGRRRSHRTPGQHRRPIPSSSA